MAPRKDTRYQYSRAFQDDDGLWFLEVPGPFRFTNESDNVSYVIKTGDTLQVLAYRYYRGIPFAAQLWRAIAEFNDIIDASLSLTVGQSIIIPSIRWIREVFLAPPDDFRYLLEEIGRSS